jgi:hypothetical protein
MDEKQGKEFVWDNKNERAKTDFLLVTEANISIFKERGMGRVTYLENPSTIEKARYSISAQIVQIKSTSHYIFYSFYNNKS